MFNGMSPRLEHVLVFDYALGMPEKTDTAHAPHCLVELQGNTLVVTMNRPEARNALSAEMMSIMSDAWDRTNSDPDVKVVILTGAGGYFCAGADLKSMSSSAPSDKFESGEFDPTIIKPLLKGFRLTKPLIAAVEGPAIAGGTEILQATDIRVAGESARFGVSEPKWGLYPLGGSAVRLPRQLPYTVAADLLLTGRHIKAPEAKEIGLIGHVVPDGEALAKAHEIADLIAANGPLAVQAVLKTIRDSEGKHEDDCWKDDAAVGAAVFASEDAKEGPRAFAERRAPQFQGR
jgi:enoyl-CoA hydratase